MVARSYKFRLYPTKVQAERLSYWQTACWDVQRLCIQQRRIAYHRKRIIGKGVQPSWASQGREITELRGAFYPDVPADLLSAISKRVDEAYKRWYKRIKAGERGGKPRWADKADQVGLQFRGQPERGTQVVAERGRFSYWKLSSAHSLGVCKVRQHRAFPEGTQVKQVHITRAADGWYISFSCEMPDPVVAAPPSTTIGIDLGCIHEGNTQRVAVVDDGRIYQTTDHLKRTAKRLATLQKMVSPKRRTRGTAKAADLNSKRTAKRQARIARLHQRVARQREHTLQYVARRLVDTAETIAFEDIQWGKLRRKGKGRAKRGLNRSMSTAAPGRLVALTGEKANKDRVVKVNARGTSQVCSACGVTGEKKGLSVRQWKCGACGTKHDRDVNAARNIRVRATNNTGAFRASVPGEGAAISDSERRSMNLEAAQPQPASNAGVFFNRVVRNSKGVSRKKQVAEQMTLFDLL